MLFVFFWVIQEFNRTLQSVVASHMMYYCGL